MSTAVKIPRPQDPDKTGEYVIPEGLAQKMRSMPKAGVIPPKVPESKKESEKIQAQIEEVKAEAVRKEDESTRVFNLRQAQLMEKIRELELRKQKSEKELNQVLHQKNTRIHDELSKATQSLLQETQGIEENIGKLGSLKNELQHFFESATEDRKKNLSILETQSKEMKEINLLLKECALQLTQEYHQSIEALRPLVAEKAQIEKSIVHLKSEETRLQGQKHELVESLRELKNQISTQEEKSADIHRTIDEHHRQTRHVHEELKGAREELAGIKTEIQASLDKKHQLTIEIAAFEEAHKKVSQNGEHLKLGLTVLNEQYEQKKLLCREQETALAENHRRIDELRSHELDLMKSCSHFSATLAQLKSEVSGFEVTRKDALRIQEESFRILTEKRDFYQAQIREIEEAHASKLAQMKQEFELKRETWEQEFRNFEAQKTEELKAALYASRVAYVDHLKASEGKVMDELTLAVKRQFSRPTFESGPQKAEAAKEEIAPILRAYFTEAFTDAYHPDAAPRKPFTWAKWPAFFSLGVVVVIFGVKLYF